MTICVAVKSPDCLVLAADSRATRVYPSAGIGFCDDAEKVFRLGDYPIGLFHWGLSRLPQRSLHDFLSEFSDSLPSLKGDPGLNIEVGVLASRLFDFIKPEYDKHRDDMWEAARSGMVIGGYSSGSRFPELYSLQLKAEGSCDLPSSPTLLFPDSEDGARQFGPVWFGEGNPLSRLVIGSDEKLLERLENWWSLQTHAVDHLDDPERIEFPVENLKSLLSRFERPLCCDLMHAQDAIDCAVYLVNVVIGLNRFWRYPATCGGEISVAVIRRTSFEQFKQQAWL